MHNCHFCFTGDHVRRARPVVSFSRNHDRQDPACTTFAGSYELAAERTTTGQARLIVGRSKPTFIEPHLLAGPGRLRAPSRQAGGRLEAGLPAAHVRIYVVAMPSF